MNTVNLVGKISDAGMRLKHGQSREALGGESATSVPLGLSLVVRNGSAHSVTIDWNAVTIICQFLRGAETAAAVQVVSAREAWH